MQTILAICLFIMGVVMTSSIDQPSHQTTNQNNQAQEPSSVPPHQADIVISQVSVQRMAHEVQTKPLTSNSSETLAGHSVNAHPTPNALIDTVGIRTLQSISIYELMQTRANVVEGNVLRCLADLTIPNISEINSFANNLKDSCEMIRNKQPPHLINGQWVGGKQAEQIFCEKIVKTILGNYKSLAMSLTNPKELENLTFIAQSMIALANVQHRFGGRLGFHCLPHSQMVGVNSVLGYYKGTTFEFAALCCGANHDAVMTYAKPPDLNSSAAIYASHEFMEFRKQFELSEDVLVDTSIGLMGNNEHANAVYHPLKSTGQQDRIAGWNSAANSQDVGDSERASYEQMEAQIARLLAVAQEVCRGSVVAQCRENIHSLEGFRQQVIQGTIPDRSHFAAPGFGDKLSTVGNVGMIPAPVALSKMEPGRLRDKLIQVIDQAIKEAQPGVQDPATYQRAIDDMAHSKRFYELLEQTEPLLEEQIDMITFDRIDSAHRAGEVVDTGKIREAVREEVLKKPIKERLKAEFRVVDDIPRFLLPLHREADAKMFLAAMPPFADPLKNLGEGSSLPFLAALSKGFKENPEVRDYMLKQMQVIGVGIADLGALMLEGAETEWSIQESVALLVEENPYQAEGFFAVNQKLLVRYPLGLRDENVHLMLRDLNFRIRMGIAENEYNKMLEFTFLAQQFIKSQANFARGRIQMVQHYIYEPLIALRSILDDPDVTEQRANIRKIVDNFESLYTVRNSQGEVVLRETAVGGVAQAMKRCQSCGSLSQLILEQMNNRFGPDFEKNPSEYGYTKSGQVDAEFIKEQAETTKIL